MDSVETWVFDDDAVDLVQDAFISGVPEMIDELLVHIPDARGGFRLLFPAAPYPGFQRKLMRECEEFGGWWYRSDEPGAEVWLCLALFRYSDEAPAEIYVRAEAR